MKPKETELLSELKRGNHTSFEKIFELYSKPLYRFSLNYLKSKEAAEDVVQEVFIKIWDNRKEIKRDTSFQSFLFTIALNSVRRHFNRLSRLNDIKHDILLDFAASETGFDDRPGYQELLDKLHDYIERMPEKQKEVFIRKKLEEKSIKEIAEELAITPKTVEYHITGAMKFLKAEFKKLKVNGIVFFHLFIEPKNF